MYVCGATVYDYCHLGHARMMLVFDVVQRWLKTLGYQVTYVRNITDIDDKIIKRAIERGITLKALTDEMIGAMHEDILQLGIEPPTHEPRATDYIPQALSMIQRLEDRGLAYRTQSSDLGEGQGDVNFSVRKFAGYGKLSGRTLDQLRSGERVAVDLHKADPLDFVLWKSAKPEEPEEAKFPSPYGPGRPGWHIECSAMSCDFLGAQFDLHGGGLDLQFPHHENEIAQSEGATQQQPFVKFWMHNGFVNLDNEKMSKSLGNFFTIRDVLKAFDGETLRFSMLRVHYRSPFHHSDTALEDARQGLKRLYTCLANVFASTSISLPSENSIDWTHPMAARFKAAMDEDFNTPQAIAVLFDLATEINRAKEADASSSLSLGLLMKSLGKSLGLLQQIPEAYLQAKGILAGLTPEAIQAQIDLRTLAKRNKDFSMADQIRRELAEQGIVLNDSASGTTWTRA